MIDHDVRSVVTATAAEVLAVDHAVVSSAPTLPDVPTYNSFRVIEIIERLEEHFAIEIDADELTPDNLGSIEALTALCKRCALASVTGGSHD